MKIREIVMAVSCVLGCGIDAYISTLSGDNVKTFCITTAGSIFRDEREGGSECGACIPNHRSQCPGAGKRSGPL